MKAKYGRPLIAACTVMIGAAFQWISGEPFERSPDEAFYIGSVLVFGLWLSTCPLITFDKAREVKQSGGA